MDNLVLKALEIAQEKDQRVGENQYWFITIEQLNNLVEESYEKERTNSVPLGNN